MPLERPEPGFVWLHVPRKGSVDVVVCGELYTWWAHWAVIPGTRRQEAVRCARADGGICAWCDGDYGRRARYVFPVRVGDAVRLVELGRVQYSSLAMVWEEGRWIGARFRLEREWDAANARIRVTYVGREVLSEEVQVDISEYVSTLGLSASQRWSPPGVGLPLRGSDGSQSREPRA